MMELELDPQSIEKWEFHYFNEIYFLLEQEKEKMLLGLHSKEKIRSEWDNYFYKENKRQNSDFSRGAKRIYFWLFNQFGKPNSAPMGADMLFETYNAFVHIDIKTCKQSNELDWKDKIPVGRNQNSYQIEGIKSNLPLFYKFVNKYCFTYILSVVYDEKSLAIKSIKLISIPNGILKEVYGEDVFTAGKAKGESLRFLYKKCKFSLIKGQPDRYKEI